MQKTIWKFPLDITDIQTVHMPVGAEILSVANQDDVLCLWAMVDPVIDPIVGPEQRQIEIIGTGNPVNCDAVDRTFIGTVVMSSFVWHVFEVKFPAGA